MGIATSRVSRLGPVVEVAARLSPYLFLVPAVLVVGAILVYPLVASVQTSLHFFRFGEELRNVGLDNYVDVIKDPVFRSSLWTTLKFITLAVALETLLGLALALACMRGLPFLRTIRATLMLPMVLMPVVVGIVFRLLYASDVGFLRIVTGNPVEILSQPGTAFLAIVALDVWEWTPLMFLIILAGLQSLPSDPLEAAQMDGAGAVRTFVDVTLPLLRPAIVVAVALRTIEAFSTFDQVYVLTQGGPGRSTELISLYGYEAAFKFQQTGFATAMLLMVAALIVTLVGLLVLLSRRRSGGALA